MDSIKALSVREVVPVTVSKRDPQTPTSEPSDVMAGRIPARSPMEGSGSAECQPKLVTKPNVNFAMPTHARPQAAITLTLAAPYGDDSG